MDVAIVMLDVRDCFKAFKDWRRSGFFPFAFSCWLFTEKAFGEASEFVFFEKWFDRVGVKLGAFQVLDALRDWNVEDDGG